MSEDLFTPTFIETLWTEPSPLPNLAAAIKDDTQLFDEPDNPECLLLAEIMLHVICDAIEEVRLSYVQAAQWVRAVYGVLKENVSTKQFSKELDFRKLTLALAGCKDLTRDHLAKLLSTSKTSYLAHFNLFAQVFTSPREQAHINFTYVLDLPDIGLPLAAATLIEPPPPIQEDTTKTVTLEEFRSEMQDEYKYVGVDDATRASIMERLKKARSEMAAQLEQRQKQMQDKIAVLENPKKRK